MNTIRIASQNEDSPFYSLIKNQLSLIAKHALCLKIKMVLSDFLSVVWVAINVMVKFHVNYCQFPWSGIAGISFCGLQKETVWINYLCLVRLLTFAVLLTGQGEQGIEWRWGILMLLTCGPQADLNSISLMAAWCPSNSNNCIVPLQFQQVLFI